MNVFFYGLFMDEAVLAEQAIVPCSAAVGYVDDFALRIAERATLVRSVGARAYGVVMDITPEQVAVLYSAPSVADYVAETVVVMPERGSPIRASCYNLPPGTLAGTNLAYAQALLVVAGKLDLPESYLAQIREAT